MREHIELKLGDHADDFQIVLEAPNDLAKLDKKVDKLLKVDYKCAMKCFGKAIDFLEHNDHREACKELERVIDYAEKAFYLVDKFRLKVQCKGLYCRSRIITMCYDDKTGKINPLSTLPEEMKSTIAELIFGELEELVGEFERIKKPWAITKWVPGVKKDKKKKEQREMDRLLKVMLPIMWPHVEEFKEMYKKIVSFK